MNNKLFRIILFIFCLKCLLYQSKYLLDDYLSGKTIVSLELKPKQIDTIPAVTVCLPHFYSLEKISRANDELAQIYSEYLNLSCVFNEPLQDGCPFDKTSRFLINAKKKLEKLSLKMLMKISKIQDVLTVYEMVDNFSISMNR